MSRLARGVGVGAAALLVVVAVGVARRGGASPGRAMPPSAANPVVTAAAAAMAPAPPAAVLAGSPPPPGPSAAAPDAGTPPWGDTSALVAAEQLRLEVCDCEDLACVAAANKRFARSLGEIDPRTAGPAARSEMHAANLCVARLLAAASDAGSSG